MKKYFWSLVIVVAFIEIYSVRPHSHEENNPTDPGIKHFLPGAIHVHTKASDGGHDVEDIASAAKRAGLEFVVITDVNNSEARAKEGTYDKVDLFVEMEVATSVGHLLTFYSHTDAVKENDSRISQLAWQHFQGKTEVPGMFNIVAHPSHPKTPWNALDRQPEGIEVINFDSQWRKQWEDSSLSFGLTLLTYPFSNFLTGLRFAQMSRKDLVAWDAMNAISPGRFGILAEHSHANLRLPGQLAVRWPEHEQVFKTGTTVLFYEPPLARDFESRKKQIYELIRQGKSAMVFNFIYPFRGNDWYLDCGGEQFRSGDTPPENPQCEFVAQLPRGLGYPVVLRFWKSGELFREIRTEEAMTRIPIGGPGVYRLEVWLEAHTLFRVLLSGEVPYLFYNPIYVR